MTEEVDVHEPDLVQKCDDLIASLETALVAMAEGKSGVSTKQHEACVESARELREACARHAARSRDDAYTVEKDVVAEAAWLSARLAGITSEGRNPEFFGESERRRPSGFAAQRDDDTSSLTA